MEARNKGSGMKWNFIFIAKMLFPVMRDNDNSILYTEQKKTQNLGCFTAPCICSNTARGCIMLQVCGIIWLTMRPIARSLAKHASLSSNTIKTQVKYSHICLTRRYAMEHKMELSIVFICLNAGLFYVILYTLFALTDNCHRYFMKVPPHKMMQRAISGPQDLVSSINLTWMSTYVEKTQASMWSTCKLQAGEPETKFKPRISWRWTTNSPCCKGTVYFHITTVEPPKNLFQAGKWMRTTLHTQVRGAC